MIGVFFLKMLWDAAIYYMFAAPVAAYFGSGDFMLCMVLQCLIYTVSRIPKSRVLRFCLLIPMAGCYLLQNTLPAFIVLSPITLYALWLSITDKPAPSLSQQRESFEDFWKVLCLAIVLALCFQNFSVLPPFALTALLSSILLLRTLRHSPEVYNQPRFHCINLLAVSVVPAAAYLLGSRTVISGIKAILLPIYRYVLTPLLMLLAWIPMMMLQWILDLFIPDSVQELDRKPEMMEGFEEIQEVVSDFSWVKILFLCVVAVTLLCAIIFLLRKIKPGTVVSESRQIFQTTYDTVAYERHVSEQSSAAVASIRRYYRRFLKLCEKNGLRRKESSTSAEIDKMAKGIPGINEESAHIRQLYIRARYGSHASSEDTLQMRKLLAQVKRDTKNGR